MLYIFIINVNSFNTISYRINRYSNSILMRDGSSRAVFYQIGDKVKGIIIDIDVTF